MKLLSGILRPKKVFWTWERVRYFIKMELNNIVNYTLRRTQRTVRGFCRFRRHCSQPADTSASPLHHAHKTHKTASANRQTLHVHLKTSHIMALYRIKNLFRVNLSTRNFSVYQAQTIYRKTFEKKRSEKYIYVCISRWYERRNEKE